MKRGRLGLAATTIVVAAFGMSPARSAPHWAPIEGPPAAPPCAAVQQGSFGGHGYLYCGYHWTSWPVTFGVDAPPALSNVKVDATRLTNVTRAVAGTWNDAWRASGGSTNALRYVANSPNRVMFGSLPENVIGRTYTTLSGNTKIIIGATIVLNSNLKWIEADAVQSAGGSVAGFSSGDWHDVQDVLTHEFGHMLGLEHPGTGASCWPSDLREGVDAQQTMYACGYAGETYKRTLDWGDILGIERVGRDST